MSVKKLLNKTKGDQVIWAVVMVLSLISLLAVYSSTGSLAYRSEKASSFFLLKQVMVLGLGLLIIYWVHNINYTKFAKVAVVLYLCSLPLLIYTLAFGAEINKGSRWIKLPVVNLTFQTSDLAKLALFMFLARVLSMKQPVIKDFRKGFIPVLVPMLLTCAFIAPANLSTALMLGVTCSIVFFIGRVRVQHLLCWCWSVLWALPCCLSFPRLQALAGPKPGSNALSILLGAKRKTRAQRTQV
jgi:cell division protein FtsW